MVGTTGSAAVSDSGAVMGPRTVMLGAVVSESVEFVAIAAVV
jgi:hypothetical protein